MNRIVGRVTLVAGLVMVVTACDVASSPTPTRPAHATLDAVGELATLEDYAGGVSLA